MFKKLFSVHTGADALANNLIEVFKDERASQNKLTKVSQEFIDKIKTSSPAEATNAIKRIAELILLPDVERAALASLVCGNLVELGYNAGDVNAIFTPRYKQLLSIAAPTLFYLQQKLDEHEDSDEEDEEEEADEHEMLARLTEERQAEYPEEVRAVQALDKLYSCGIAVYSSNPQYLQQAATELQQVSAFTNVSVGCNWLSQLFAVLINEPLLVINTINNKAIIAEMSGVADNFQLQQFLMATPELLDGPSAITKEMLDVIQGNGRQNLGKSTTGAWNLNNWQYIKHYNPPAVKQQHADSKYWIWGEGKPADIPVFEGYRVIILTPPAYNRGFNVQRTFTALKASVRVTKVLAADEIAGWLQKFKQ